jgi:hypothetical protein
MSRFCLFDTRIPYCLAKESTTQAERYPQTEKVHTRFYGASARLYARGDTEIKYAKHVVRRAE